MANVWLEIIGGRFPRAGILVVHTTPILGQYGALLKKTPNAICPFLPWGHSEESPSLSWEASTLQTLNVPALGPTLQPPELEGNLFSLFKTTLLYNSSLADQNNHKRLSVGCLLRCSIQKTDTALLAAGGKWTQRVLCLPALHLPFLPTSCLHSSRISSCRSVSLTLPLQRRAWSTMGPNNRMGCIWKSNQTPSSLFPPAPRVTFFYKLISGNFSRCRHWIKWNIFHCKFPYCLGYFICLKLLYF